MSGFYRRAWRELWRGDPRAPAQHWRAALLGTLGATLGAWLGDRWWLRKHGAGDVSRET